MGLTHVGMILVSVAMALVVSVLIILVDSSFIAGMVLLIQGFNVCFSLSWGGSYWLGFIYFMVYVGGLLVLFFYMFSMDSNPFLTKGRVYLVIFSVLSLLGVSFFQFSGLESSGLDVLENLFSSSESLSMVGILGFLLWVLWLMGKMLLKGSGSFRPFSVG